MSTVTIIFIIAGAAVLGAVTARAVRGRRQIHRKMQQNIDLGDDVSTTGGIRGTVVSFTEAEVTIESGSKGSEIVVARNAITSVSHQATII